MREEIIKELADMGIEAELRSVDKGNGVILNGIAIKTGTNISPTVYYEDNEPMESIMEKVRYAMQHTTPDIDLSILQDYDKAKEKMTLALYSTAPSGVLAYSVFGDLVAVPIVVFESDGIGQGSVKIQEGMFSVDREQIYADALEAAKRNEPSSVMTMREQMIKMGAPEDLLPPEGDDMGMLVVTNKDTTNGASAILYAEIPYDDYYVLPSSRHEMLIVPTGLGDVDESQLLDMVRTINKTQVMPVDRLSDNVYHVVDGKVEVIK